MEATLEDLKDHVRTFCPRKDAMSLIRLDDTIVWSIISLYCRTVIAIVISFKKLNKIALYLSDAVVGLTEKLHSWITKTVIQPIQSKIFLKILAVRHI